MNFAKAFFDTVGGFTSHFSRTIPGRKLNDPELAKMFGAQVNSSAGVAVTSETAIGLPAVKRGLEILANGMMNKTCDVVQCKETGDEPDTDHSANTILRRVNQNLLFSDWIHTMQLWAAFYGNAVSSIESDGNGGYSLYPFLPTNTELVMADGLAELSDIESQIGKKIRLLYRTKINGEHVYRLPENVIHIQGFGGNGYWGWSLLELFKNTFGGDIAAREHGNKVFAQGATAKGFVKLQNALTDAIARKRLVESIQSVTGGLQSSHRIAVLEEAAEFQPFERTNSETQLLEKLEFDTKDLANAIGIQAAKLGVRSEQSYNSLEMAEAEHQKDDMQSWQTRWEDELSSKLLTPTEFLSGSHKIVFSEKLDFVPFREKGETAIRLYHGGLVDKNGGRKLLKLPPVNDGNDWLRPANIMDANALAESGTIAAAEPVTVTQPAPEPPAAAADPTPAEEIAAIITDNLAAIGNRLQKVAEKKIDKGLAEFIGWVDTLETAQGPASLHRYSVPYVQQIKDELTALIDTPGGTAENLKPEALAIFDKAEL